MEDEQVASHRHLRARHRRELHDALHLILGQVVHYIALGALELTLHAVVWVRAYFVEFQRPVQHRLQAFVVIIHRVAADKLSFHASIYLILSERDVLPTQPHIEAVDILRRQIFPARHLPILGQLINQRLIALFRRFRDVRSLGHLLDPYNQRRVVGIRCRLQLPHLMLDAFHVDRLASIQAIVHLFFHETNDSGQALIQQVSILSAFDVSHGIAHEPFSSHAHTRINIVCTAVDGYANLHGAFLALLGSLVMVMDE